MKRSYLGLIFMGLLILALAACTPTDVGLPDTGIEGTPLDPTTGDIPQAALSAAEDLAMRLNLSVTSVEVLEAERVEWPDACLDLPELDEACAEVVTPGWRVVLEADGVQYVYHTDEQGMQVRTQDAPEAPAP